MEEIKLYAVATVHNERDFPRSASCQNLISEITLADEIPDEAFDLIESFSHLQILFYFDRVDPEMVIYSGHPRNNPEFPVVGIFGHCNQKRPNHIGMTIVELISHAGRTIRVKGLDAINRTPVLDIKPVFKEIPARDEIRQPAWADEIMINDAG